MTGEAQTDGSPKMPEPDCVVDAATFTILTAQATVMSSSLYNVSHFVKDGDTTVELAHFLSRNTSHSVQHITVTSSTNYLTYG